SDHLRFLRVSVQGKTAAGNWTTDLLDLNDPNAVQWRNYRLRVLATIMEQQRRLRGSLKVVQKRMARARGAGLRVRLVKQRTALMALLGETQREAAFVSGA